MICLFTVASLIISVIWMPYALYHPVSIPFLQLLLDARNNNTIKGAGGMSELRKSLMLTFREDNSIF